MSVRKLGIITTEYGAFPEAHEIATAKIFIKNGFDVRFITPRRVKNMKTPDVEINGILWEIKSPTSTGKQTLQRLLKKAAKQSDNIIIDDRRTNSDDAYYFKELKRLSSLSHSIRRLKLITKSGKIIDIKK